ncbi:MAG: RDD family protein [Chloroflexi bacterium]|nr:RDD family protein [Chloroflexota bacterium]
MARPQCATASDGPAELNQQAGGPASAEAAPTAEVEYAGFWKRLAAGAIDFAILLLIGFCLSIIIPILIGPIVGLPDDIYLVGAVVLFWLVAPWLYYSLFERSSKQGTPGKTTMEIMVTDTEGGRLSFGRATKRYWAKYISAVTLLAGFIMIGFTARRQGLHDIAARCLVVTGK